MSNMNYCRFHNTLIDLSECIEAMENQEKISADERIKAKKLLITFLEFAEEYSIIKSYNMTNVNDIIDDME